MKVKVSSPAGIGNIVCGFDVLGLSLDLPADIIELELTGDNKTIIHHTDDFGISEDPDVNIAGIALKAIQKHLDQQHGFIATIKKLIRPGSGLGSSAASAAGIVVAADHLLGNIFTKEQLVQFAMEGEYIASGGYHADNIAPCIYGGINIIRSVKPIDVIKVPCPDVYITIVHPMIEIKTSEARAILPKQVELYKAVNQWANIAALVAAFYSNDVALMSRALNDNIIEPVRSRLIPHFDEVKEKCLQHGALGGGIAGSGPAIFMMSNNIEKAGILEETMASVYRKAGIEYNTYVTTINKQGVKILS
jgi:homoserine kinase